MSTTPELKLILRHKQTGKFVGWKTLVEDDKHEALFVTGSIAAWPRKEIWDHLEKEWGNDKLKWLFKNYKQHEFSVVPIR